MPQTPPPPKPKPYNQRLAGVYGEFGTGANAQIFYLQSTLKPQELDRATLISDIAGSEAWPVRDLFQREVDVRRVTRGLLPYLQNRQKIKFFNPLTLTILPIDPETNQVLIALPNIVSKTVTEDNVQWDVLESEGYYRFCYMAEAPEYARLEWNDARTRLVAIDGQHRLSALKRYLDDIKNSKERADFLRWSIPVVVIGFRAVAGGAAAASSILELVRSIFIYINTEARQPNRARQILLTDESVNAVCAQELLQRSHSNDLLPPGQQDKARLPLLFYDWRGEEEDGKRVFAPSSVHTIEEVTDWLINYILGDDFTPQQEIALSVQPVDSVKRAFVERRLPPALSVDLRKLFDERVLPGVAYLLEEFSPYKRYAERLRQLEEEYLIKSDVARHAFYQLRFGTNRGGEDIQKSIREIYEELVKRINALKEEILKPPMNLDIGMRGVMSAFGMLRSWYAESEKTTADWKTYADWFTAALNQAWSDGVLSGSRKEQQELLLHITHDHNETIVNYRLDDVPEAFGVYIAVFVACYGQVLRGIPKATVWAQRRDEAFDRILGTITRGYKRQWRPTLREQFPQGGKPLTDAVQRKAEEEARKHMKKLERALEGIVQRKK
jgi:hypothetical protein